MKFRDMAAYKWLAAQPEHEAKIHILMSIIGGHFDNIYFEVIKQRNLTAANPTEMADKVFNTIISDESLEIGEEENE